MAESITFMLPMPPSVNALYSNAPGRGRVKTKRYRDWIKEAEMWLMGGKTKSLAPPYRVEYAIGKPDKRKRDVANLEKALSDLLVKQGILVDDSHINDNRQRWADDVEPGMVRCVVESLA